MAGHRYTVAVLLRLIRMRRCCVGVLGTSKISIRKCYGLQSLVSKLKYGYLNYVYIWYSDRMLYDHFCF
jgi:hypothetical protein